MESYPAIKKNEIMPFAATWMDLETVILSEVSQTEGEIPCDIAYIWSLKRTDTNELTKQKDPEAENELTFPFVFYSCCNKLP